MNMNHIWQKICGIGIVALLLFLGAASDVSANREQTVQVGLTRDKSRYTITSNVPFLVTDTAGKQVFLKLRAGEKAIIESGEQNIIVNGKETTSRSVFVKIDEKSKNGLLNLDGNLYRGGLAISYGKNKGQTKKKTGTVNKTGNKSQSNNNVKSVSKQQKSSVRDSKTYGSAKSVDKNEKSKSAVQSKAEVKKNKNTTTVKTTAKSADKNKANVKTASKDNNVPKSSKEKTPAEEKAKLLVVNKVDLEEYLFGVVANEMSSSWPTEALKAQAVAARTFVLHDLKKHAADGYDVCATTHCQVYRGQKSERASTNKAVTATAGEYLTYNGKLISSVFHASSGGYTENSENVWGSKVEYLRGVPDYDQKSPVYKWEVKMTADKMASILEKRGKSVGKILAVKLSKLDKTPVTAEDRGVSGRVRTMTIEGEKGSVILSGNEARTAFGLKSTLFDLDKREFSDKNDEMITICGFGYGHGIGMSQWGAKAMAEEGKNEAGLYKKILKHYYQGAELKK